jgi:alpha-amylase/alpha-mannosidase (GH57 family)
MADTLYHALVLNLHQPHGNLEHLLQHNEWEAREILFAMDRIPRSLADCQDIGRVHLALSATLLETLTHSDFQSRAYGIVDCSALIWSLCNSSAIDMLGTAYYHPVMPLIPPADWPAQLERWRGFARRLFYKSDFQGFWPPEMGFCM